MAQWFSELVPPPHTRRPLTIYSFLRELLPPIICYYATAVLIQLRGTFAIRLGLLPVTLWLAFRAATRLDLAAGYNDEGLIYLNQGLVLVMTTLGIRVIIWMFRSTPFQRLSSMQKSNPTSNSDRAVDYTQVALDACDLFCNLRGLGWNWSTGLQIPPETRPTESNSSFAVATSSALIRYIALFDALHYSVQWFSPSTIGSPVGGSIFDETIPPLQRYLRSTSITFLSGLTIYTAMQTVYHLTTLIGVLVFRQHSSQWPPIFDAPWLSTSLTDFWAKRWHQLFRDNFISLGARPLSMLVGRVGGVLGAFLVSGILHDFGMWGMGRGGDFQKVGGYFLIMGLGIIMEYAWRRATGSRVGGLVGWIWTMVWVVGWGHLITDTWSRKGLIGSTFFPHNQRPTDYIFGPLS